MNYRAVYIEARAGVK